jgi:hypothetical protein
MCPQPAATLIVSLSAPSACPPASSAVPRAPAERGPWLLALALALLGALALTGALTGVIAAGGGARVLAPALPAAATVPSPSAAQSALVLERAGAPAPAAPRSPAGSRVRGPAAATSRGATVRHISVRWMEGFYPIYGVAQATFGVNWLLLASIHRQESAFSTARGTYHGLNFAACCGGPMQFNVTNRPFSTWELVADSYRYGRRPAAYGHMMPTHPSVYDDFDSIMAAAHLLSADGAGFALDAGAWVAAYDYYGHDRTGVAYADEVLARAIGWSQHGFCINCGVAQQLVDAVHAAYGAPVLAALEQAERQHLGRAAARRRRG